MKAAISKWVEDLIKNPVEARKLIDAINGSSKDAADADTVVLGGKRYRVRLAGSVPVTDGSK